MFLILSKLRQLAHLFCQMAQPGILKSYIYDKSEEEETFS